MKVVFLTLTIAIFLLMPLFAQAQPEPLDGDLDFFQKKAPLYQRWLDSTGLGQVIKVDHVRLKPSDNTELELILVMNTNDLDTAAGQWAQLKKDFDTPADSVERYLYHFFEYMMELPPERGNIQIYVKNDRGEFIPCFYIFIWMEEGRLIVRKKMDDCKSMFVDVPIKSIKLKNISKGKNTKIQPGKAKSADETFDIILNYFDQKVIKHPKYGPNGGCAGKKPFRERGMKRTETSLSFSIQDLCREVLDDESNSKAVDLLNWVSRSNYNDKARERLTFTFEYIKSGNDIRLKGTIEGKFGNGVFKPRTEGYMEMEPDFQQKLESYTNELYNTLYKLLNQ